MLHYGGGVGHINGLVPSTGIVASSERDFGGDSDSEEEAVREGSVNASESDDQQDDAVMRVDSDADEVDEEMATGENDEELENGFEDEDDILDNEEDAVDSDDDGYASL
jgi:hypothetical protein